MQQRMHAAQQSRAKKKMCSKACSKAEKCISAAQRCNMLRFRNLGRLFRNMQSVKSKRKESNKSNKSNEKCKNATMLLLLFAAFRDAGCIHACSYGTGCIHACSFPGCCMHSPGCSMQQQLRMLFRNNNSKAKKGHVPEQRKAVPEHAERKIKVYDLNKKEYF